MKYPLLVLAFVIPISAYAINTPRPEALVSGCPSCQEIDLLARIVSGDFSTTNCDEGQTDQLQNAVVETQVQTLRLLDGITSRLQTDRANTTFWNSAKTKLECVKEKMERFTVECKHLSGGAHGHFTPILGGRTVEIDLDEIDSWYNRPTNGINDTIVTQNMYIASTILHELTHMCGTNDAEYFPLPTDDLRHNGRRSSASTADTYQNWAQWGLCLPGPECASRPIPYKPK